MSYRHELDARLVAAEHALSEIRRKLSDLRKVEEKALEAIRRSRHDIQVESNLRLFKLLQESSGVIDTLAPQHVSVSCSDADPCSTDLCSRCALLLLQREPSTVSGTFSWKFTTEFPK